MKQRIKTVIMNELKEKGLHAITKKIKSITSDHNTVDVKTVNLTKQERDTLDKILEEYRMGDFDGMDDSYKYKENRSPKATYRYVFIHNNFSDDVRTRAVDHLKTFDVTNDESSMRVFGRWYEQMIWTALNEMENV